jgi:HSP20 family protein
MVLERRRPSLDILPWRSFWMPSDGERGWTPALDIFEKDDRFVVKAELPGIKEEEIDEKDYYHMERTYGSFFRSISLPSNVNADKIEAKFEDGVLEVSLPKTAEVKPKKVKVATKKKTEK